MTETAQIFLAEQRGCSETAWFRSIHSFNFGNYQDPSRKPFGALKLWNDETLAAQKSLSLTVEEDITLVILPIVGGVELKYLGESNFVAAGQALSLCLNVGATYQITNPYPDELVNFLQIWLIGHAAEDSIKTDFDLRHKNQLLLLFSGNSQGFIGQYNGREEGLYNLTNTQHGIFVFVIEGVFEVQNRLLHARDGLSLQNVASIDFEALSNEAILVLLETPLQSQPA